MTAKKRQRLDPGAAPAPEDETLYTRFCSAPRPLHPLGEPRLTHAMLVATWIGRLVEPLPHQRRGPHS